MDDKTKGNIGPLLTDHKDQMSIVRVGKANEEIVRLDVSIDDAMSVEVSENFKDAHTNGGCTLA